MSTQPETETPKNIGLLFVGALGVVFGDIGTSPLYALKVAVEASHGGAAGGLEPAVLGILSLITWALLVVVTLKYVMLIMRADNHGEGGVFALTALVMKKASQHTHGRWAVTIAGSLGAALFFGDSLITPAISVLSAVEGLKVLAPELSLYVIPISIALITALFAVERFGTGKVSIVFGPVMLIWFLVLGALGLMQIIQNPTVLVALNPLIGIVFLVSHPTVAVAILGAVVLAITGGEALYADMGHFGRRPIQRAWLVVVFPALILNYFGQGALLIKNPAALDNPFYRLAPDWSLIPLLGLAFLATIIASQAVISGAFSIAKQAIQLGYIPRLRIKHTSAGEIGQVYVSKVNLFLYLGVVILVLAFKNSESLASAYGISVTGAMAIDTLLAGYFFIAVKDWNKSFFLPLIALLVTIDLMFLIANLFKFLEGGWLPIAVAAIAMAIMLSWIVGRDKLLEVRWSGAVALTDFLAGIKPDSPLRIAGTAIFMVPHDDIVPMALLHNLKHNKVLHERVILMRVVVDDVPTIPDTQRVTLTHLDHNFHAVVVHYGFMEEPNIPRVLAFIRAREFHITLMETSFFIGNDKVVIKKSSLLALALFGMLHRGMVGATEYFQIPSEHTIEIGGHVEI